jgi:hypothetical protein
MNDPTLFPFRHDWGQPFKVTREWLTDVITANDGSETRVQLRANPNIAITMRVLFLTEMGAGRLLAQWRGATQPLRYYAPLWCDATDLTANVTGGDGTIICDTTDRPFFVNGGKAMLFRDEEHAEVVTIDTVSSSSFTLTGTAANSYTAFATRVVPVRPMWLNMPVTVTWLSGRIAQVDLSFVDQKDQAGLGLDGTDTTATATSLLVAAHDMGRVDDFAFALGQNPMYVALEAMPFDALGVPLPAAPVAWSGTAGLVITVTTNPRFVRVYCPVSGRVTATAGSASYLFDVG